MINSNNENILTIREIKFNTCVFVCEKLKMQPEKNSLNKILRRF